LFNGDETLPLTNSIDSTMVINGIKIMVNILHCVAITGSY